MMRRAFCLLFILYFSFNSKGQISIIGRTLLNGTPVSHSKVFIKEKGVVTQSLSTGAQSDFLIKLNFGKTYQLCIQNSNCPLLYFEVVANTIPADKYAYRMPYELVIPMVNKNDEDIDTTVFKDPFYRIVFDGQSKMVADTLYNRRFSEHILKKQNNALSTKNESSVIYVGKLVDPRHPDLKLNEQKIEIIGVNGAIFRTVFTDHFGRFVFRSSQPIEISSIRAELKDSVIKNGDLQIHSSKGQPIITANLQNNSCTWVLHPGESSALIDNSFMTHIGGKMVISSQKEKRFYADKTIYLLNKMHTIIDKTKTNVIGSFVFNEIKPDQCYCIAIDKEELLPGEKADILNKDDQYICSLDSLAGDKIAHRLLTNDNSTYNELLLRDNELKMDIKATIFGDNVNNPIGKLKIVLLNDSYEPIDSVITDDFGAFKFKYLPFLKRFYLSADNSDNILDVFKNILIYSSDENLIKIMTHQKGKKFNYKPLSAEILRMRDVEIEDPWLELMDTPKPDSLGVALIENKLIVENILFENNKYELTSQSKEILDKIILVLNTRKQIKVEIGAHTDSKGSDAENLKLSQMRAKSVQAYIHSAGIEEKRLVSIGYGESRPIVMCDDKHPCSEAEHARNRRIEFKIIDNNHTTK